ncbi:MAG: hypothetical protein RID42_00245 [Alphaproteobacteria bacterium]
MAVTTQKSAQVTAIDAGSGALDLNKYGASLRKLEFDFAQSGAGDAGSLASLVALPAGKVTVVLPLSRIAFSALGAARTMDLGWLAYTAPDGTAVAADPNGLDDGVDVSAAGAVVPGGTVGGAETYTFESQAGVTLTAQVNDGTIPDAATLDGYVVIAHS